MVRRALMTTAFGAALAACGGGPTPQPGGEGGAGGSSQVTPRDPGEAPAPPPVKKEARELFESAVKRAPSDPDAALDAFKSAADEDPTLGAAYFNVGRLFEQKGEADKAEEWYRKSGTQGKEFGDGLANLGAMRLRAGKESEAVGLFREAVRADPLNPGGNINLAHELRKQKQYAEAVKRVRTALKRNAENVPAYEALGRIYLDLGRFELAKLVCLQGIGIAEELAKNPERQGALDPNPAGIHNVLGLVWLRLNDVTFALQSFESAVEANPDYLPAHLNLGAITFGYRDYETAYRHFDKAATLEPKNTTALLSRAVAARGLERLDEAEKGYLAVLELDPKHVGAHYNLGVLHQEYTQKLEDALKSFEQVLRYESQDQALRKDVTQRVQAVRIQVQNLKEMEQMQREEAAKEKQAPPPPADAPPADGAGG